jgi:hypothetical protein
MAILLLILDFKFKGGFQRKKRGYIIEKNYFFHPKIEVL